MRARTPRPSAPAGAPAATPAQRLAADVRRAVALLRRSQREAAEAAKGPPENVQLLLVADDLGVSIDDLALVARDLEGLAK